MIEGLDAVALKELRKMLMKARFPEMSGAQALAFARSLIVIDELTTPKPVEPPKPKEKKKVKRERLQDSNATGSNDETLVNVADPVDNTRRQTVDATNRALVRNIENPQHDYSIIHNASYLLNGASPVMGVNGAGTPVTFQLAPPSGQTWYVKSLSIFIEDKGTPDTGDFGNINGGIANGLIGEVVLTTGTHTIFNLQTNMCIALSFGESAIYPSAGAQFFNNSDTYSGTKLFNPAIKLNGTNSELIRARVRDNLSGVDNLRIKVHYWRVT